MQKLLSKLLVAQLTLLLAVATASAATPLPPSFDEYRAERDQPQHAAAPAQPPVRPLPPQFTDFAAAQKPASQPKLQVELRASFGRALPLASATADLPAGARAEWQALQKEVNTLNSQQKNWQNAALTDTATARQLHQTLQDMQQKARALKAKLQTTPAAAAAPAPAQPQADGAAAKDADTTAAELAELENLTRELAYREQLIAQLLQAESGNSLSASLLAIQNYPVASGGVAIFALAVLWLLRGRLAELSAFGLKFRFHGRHAAKKEVDKKD